MTLLEYLEHDKEHFLNALADAGTVERSVSVIADETDRLLVKYNEKCGDPDKRQAAAYMLQTVRLSAAFADTTGEVNLRETINGTGKKGDAVKTPFLSKLLFILAAVCGIFSMIILFLNSTENFRVTDLFLALILAAAAIVCSGFAGKIYGSKGSGSSIGKHSETFTELSSGSQDLTIEKKIDAQKAYTDLHNLIYAVDRNLEQISSGQEKAIEKSSFRSEEAGLFSEQELDLYAGLLEAGYSGDSIYVLEQIEEVKLFLHRSHIEVVDYDGKNAGLFDFMPAQSQKTIRPALVLNGKTLKRGLAAGER